MPTPDYERGRQAGYAAVTALLNHDPELAGELLRQLDRPTDVAAALSIMALTCAEIAKLWAAAMGEDSDVAWAAYAQTVAGQVAGVLP